MRDPRGVAHTRPILAMYRMRHRRLPTRTPAHAFRNWASGAGDPTSDAERYALLRGVSDDIPTIDPPSTRAADYRLLVSIGPFARIQPGETVSVSVAMVCGRLVMPTPDTQPLADGTREVLPAPSAGVQVTAAPNPVRLAGSGGAVQPVRFVHLPLHATIGIYSVQGRLVKSLAAGESGSAVWDLRTSSGTTVPPGIYFYQVATRSGEARLGKLVVLR